MSAAYGDFDVAPEAGAQPDQPLSALEAALRQALECCSREQVLERVLTVLPGTRATEPEPKAGLQGNVQKVSVSLPSELIEAIRARTGAGGFSRYVSEAAQKRIRHELLGEFLDELDAEYGPVDEAGIREAMAEWPDYQDE